MLIKGREDNRKEILDYCLEEPVVNTFIIGDIENFGFSTEFQDVWYERKEGKILGIALRYHTMLIVYSKSLDMDFTKVEAILDSNNIEIISGKATVMDELSPILSSKYTRKDAHLSQYRGDHSFLESKDNISIATGDDAMEIAISYGNIPEFGHLYSRDVNVRYDQIFNRIVSGEGIHVFIKDEKGIVAHGNTTAENSYSGMIGGIFTREDKRNCGYGSQILSYLTRYLIDKSKEAALFYDNQRQDAFFKKNGFENIGIWTTLRRDIDE